VDNGVAALMAMPIAVPITLTAALAVTSAIFLKVNVSLTEHLSFLFPWRRLKLFKHPIKLAPLELVLPWKLVAVLEMDNGVAALTLRPIAVAIMLTAAPAVTNAILPRVNVSKEPAVKL